jgi:hypothetical protein
MPKKQLLPATCFVCPHHYASPILLSKAINEGWCRLDKRGMPDPKKQPPPMWCRLRKGEK